MKISRFKILALLSLLIGFTALLTPTAQARVDIAPRKLIINSRDRGGDVTVLNLGEEVSGSYRVSLVSFRQNEDGQYETLDKPLNPAFDPDQIVRFSPKQFSLPPGGRQKVRISLRLPPGLPNGDYRFHLQVLEYGHQEAPGPATPGKKSIRMSMNLGVTIPVIIRNGSTDYAAKISNVKLVSADKTQSHEAPELDMRINRQGNASVLGDLHIFWEPKGGQAKEIGRMGNLNIFSEIPGRNIKVPLSEMPAGPGTIRAQLSDDYDKGKILDEVALQK